MTVTAGGVATFGGAVTAKALDATGATIAVNGGAVTTAPGGQKFNGPVTLGANTAFTAGGEVTFAGTLTGAGKTATVNSPGVTTFGGAVTVAAVATDAPGATKINGGSVTTTGNQTFGDAVTLGANATLTAGGVVNFGGVVEGPGGLSVTATGVTFANTVGGVSNLDSLLVNAPAAVNGGLVQTNQGQTWNGPVAVGADTTFRAGTSILFAQSLTSAGKGVAAEAANVTFGGPVGIGAARGHGGAD